ncbi:MAG: HD domain-containing protein [Clostridia bacterium]|nr:HD domain-containing protein [Clostridia bacterium]
MEQKDLLDILHTAERLKDTTRHSYTSGGRHESVAEHSWRLSLMAFLIKDEYPGLDMDKVIKMCLIHDLGEAFTGDIPAFIKTDSDVRREEMLLSSWVESLPEKLSAEMHSLYSEMDALETDEAKLYKSLDKLEALIQHNEADISTWSDNEYELNFIYGAENCRFSEYTEKFRAVVNEECREKIRREKAQ